MQEDFLISIIVPIYKVEKYLDKCINSIVEQSYKNLEIILINDGSPDNCQKICNDWAKNDKRIKILNKENEGLMAAWIDGLKISNGKLISFVDADDWLEKDYILELVKPFYQYKNLDLSICDYYRTTYEKGNIVNSFPFYKSGIIPQEKLENIKKTNLSCVQGYRWNKLFKREMLISNLKYCNPKIKLWEDMCISLSCFLDSKNIFIIHKPLYNYYDRVNSMVNNYNENNINNFNLFYEKYYQLLKDKNYLTNYNIDIITSYIIHILVKSLLKSNSKNKKNIYYSFFENNFIKTILNNKLKYFTKISQKYFLSFFKMKSYFLMNFSIKVWSCYSFVKNLFKKNLIRK